MPRQSGRPLARAMRLWSNAKLNRASSMASLLIHWTAAPLAWSTDNCPSCAWLAYICNTERTVLPNCTSWLRPLRTVVILSVSKPPQRASLSRSNRFNTLPTARSSLATTVRVTSLSVTAMTAMAPSNRVSPTSRKILLRNEVNRMEHLGMGDVVDDRSGVLLHVIVIYYCAHDVTERSGTHVARRHQRRAARRACQATTPAARRIAGLHAGVAAGARAHRRAEPVGTESACGGQYRPACRTAGQAGRGANSDRAVAGQTLGAVLRAGRAACCPAR